MRSSSTMSFEPGLEYGVPWGRDLFTFVTSAAGHMMRTLQKPRKNKPSKRQVNHRRFLHNMIQRKFAEIEAANHQLAAALFSTDTSQSQMDAKSPHKYESGKYMKKAFTDSGETEISAKQQEEVKDISTAELLTNNDNSSFNIQHLPSSKKIVPASKKDIQQWNCGEELEPNNHSLLQQNNDFSYEREQSQSPPLDLENLTPVTVNLDDSIFTWLESIERIKEDSNVHISKFPDKGQEQQYLGTTLYSMSPSSPAVSPLFLDTCDFEVQVQPNHEHSSQVQPITESLHMDMMENLELLGCSEGYLQTQRNDQQCQQNDQSNMVTVWYTQSHDDQSSFQDNLNISHTDLKVMENQTDCDGGVITGGLEVRSQIPMLQENPSKSVKHGNGTCSQAACGSRYSGRNTGETVDCYLHPAEFNTIINNTVDQYSLTATWTRFEKDLEESDFLNCVLDCKGLQKQEQSNQAMTKYWEQHPSKSLTPPGVPDLQYISTDAQRSNTEIQANVNTNAVYDSPPNTLSTPTEHCYGFEILPQANGICTGDSCSYPNGECGQSVFKGVAQSFPAPMHKPHPHPVSTPPLNDDWLFSNIIADEDFNGMGKAQRCSYC